MNVPSWSPDGKQVAFVSNTVPHRQLSGPNNIIAVAGNTISTKNLRKLYTAAGVAYDSMVKTSSSPRSGAIPESEYFFVVNLQ